MRRVVWVVAILTFIAASCGTPPPPRTTGIPLIVSAVVEPATAAVGDTITIDITVLEDVAVTTVLTSYFRGPAGAEVRMRDYCSVGPIQPQGNSLFFIRLTCEVPSFFSNGSWKAWFSVLDGQYPYPQGNVTFQVTGGSNDVTGPVMESLTFDPASPVAGTPFSATLVVSDESMPLDNPGSGEFKFSLTKPEGPGLIERVVCVAPQITYPSAGLAQIEASCSQSIFASEPGVYPGVLTLRDALYLSSSTPISVTLQ